VYFCSNNATEQPPEIWAVVESQNVHLASFCMCQWRKLTVVGSVFEEALNEKKSYPGWNPLNSLFHVLQEVSNLAECRNLNCTLKWLRWVSQSEVTVLAVLQWDGREMTPCNRQYWIALQLEIYNSDCCKHCNSKLALFCFILKVNLWKSPNKNKPFWKPHGDIKWIILSIVRILKSLLKYYSYHWFDYQFQSRIFVLTYNPLSCMVHGASVWKFHGDSSAGPWASTGLSSAASCYWSQYSLLFVCTVSSYKKLAIT